MTITEKNYNKLSNIVYLLDPKHKNYASYLKEAGIYNFGNTKFQILKIKNSLDGMQAMAVAPIVHSKLEKNFKNKKIPANFRVLK
ncbi:hypothetical protein CUN10_07505 [Enterococcus faecium]|uniref:hypothetical protein n=1 Tax=Enterococcus TaxID=1350 RepID=UPI000A345F51|nr:hypothetical protein [Enterococcus faecium]EGP4883827.1 hypothetical protein [Enterococcus faecium]EGP4933875.1 hypothetical protein [Enterococcus faecium]EGP5106898.1 hypothetical protein [Enterococcus faecium]EGP5146329.1 hypothetical protein [Enterococcus faecium]EGP5285129.1 hypothetical protein [Enterococcus faecium]